MNNIKSLRTHAGLKQYKLAEIIGVHQTAVSQWEKGRTEPDARTLKKLSEVFGVTIGTILGYENSEISNSGITLEFHCNSIKKQLILSNPIFFSFLFLSSGIIFSK